MQLKGRYWILLWLVVFLGVAATVIARQTRALALARQASELQGRRAALEAEAAELERDLHEARSLRVLGEKARALGLRPAADSEMTFLSAPSPVQR